MRAFFVAVGLFTALMTIAIVRHARALRRLAELRAGEGFPEFAASFEGSDVPDEVQRKLFEWVQQKWMAGNPPFPVRGEDPLEFYPLDEGELEDTIVAIAKACGKEPPLLNVWKGQPIIKVGDIARLIAHLPTPEEVRLEGNRRLWTDQ